MTSFSSWGPTDDGRIKPDLVGNGMGVLSTSSSGNDAYTLLSGTSMASPNIAGSLLLLQELYALRHDGARSEEHTSELQSLMRISYAVFCLKKKTTLTISSPYAHHRHNATN